MAKRDEGHIETEELLQKLEKEITKEYETAKKELKEKADKYFRKFEAKDNIKREAFDNGLITKEDFIQWRLGQMMSGKRWDDMRENIARDLEHADALARSIGQSYLAEVYSINYNYGTFQIETGAKIDTSFTLYDRHTVQGLFDDTRTFYHAAGKKLTQKINSGAVIAWNKKQIQSIMLQGILQGESIPHLATRLAESTAEKNRKSAIRNARTMTTGVQNAGRVDAYTRAEGMGIETMQEWISTLDERTRYEHRQLDGMRVAVGESFAVDGYTLSYPGDPYGAAEMVYNCRCTLVPVVVGFEIDSADTSLRYDEKLGDMSYSEWKETRESTSNDILEQDRISAIMTRKYMQDYNALIAENELREG